MSEPHVRPTIALGVIQILIVLGLVFGWVAAAGIATRTLLDGNYTLRVELGNAQHDRVAEGIHSLGNTASASAAVTDERRVLHLFDVAPLPFLGVRFLSFLALAAALLALHKLDRVVRATTGGQPFSLANASRCQWIGWWMTISWLVGQVALVVRKLMVNSATVEAHLPVTWGGDDLDPMTLLLGCCGFCAAAILRYGNELEQDRALTV